MLIKAKRNANRTMINQCDCNNDQYVKQVNHTTISNKLIIIANRNAVTIEMRTMIMQANSQNHTKIV